MWVRKGTFFLKTKTNLLPKARKPLSGSQTWFLRQFLSLIGGILEVLKWSYIFSTAAALVAVTV